MKLSVVIPCFNEEPRIGEQLEALAGQEWDGEWEVVVSDNGSTDGSLAVVEGFLDRLPRLRTVDASDVRGQANARNVGIQAAEGELILNCDADDVVADDFVSAMARALETHDFVACRLEVTRLNEPWLVENWGNDQHTGLLEFHPRFLPFAGAGTLGFNRSVFDRVGGFDPEIPVREDNDFCWRVQLAGIPLHFVKETAVHYRLPVKYSHIYRQSRRLAEAQVRLYRKYRPLGLPELPRREALRGKVSWRRLLKQAPRLPRYDRSRKARFVRALGHKVGRLQGSLRYRALAL